MLGKNGPMPHRYRFVFVLTGLLALAVSPSRAATTAKNLQTISVFHRPESVTFSLDGRSLYVANCGSDVFGEDRGFVGFVRGMGAISRLEVSRKGKARVTDLMWVKGLDSPLGMAILPKATALFPRGTLLVNSGIALLTDNAGLPVRDEAQLGTGILFIDPDSGEQLGKIDLGSGSVVAREIGHVTLLPNSLAFDADGDLYVTDTAKGGDRLEPPVDPNPGLIRIAHSSIDKAAQALARNSTDLEISFVDMPGVPNGVGYWAEEKAVCVVTMGGNEPQGTAIYKIPENDFPLSQLPAPFRGDVGRADGIAFTPAGTIVTSRFTGDLLAVSKEGEIETLRVTPFAAPADHRLTVLPDGSSLLAVPDQDRKDPRPWSQDVRLIKLPKGF